MPGTEFIGSWYSRYKETYCDSCYRVLTIEDVYCPECGYDGIDDIRTVGMSAEEISIRGKSKSYVNWRKCQFCYNKISRYNVGMVCNACKVDIADDLVKNGKLYYMTRKERSRLRKKVKDASKQ